MRSIFLSLVAINVIVLLMQLFMRSPAPAGTDAAPLPKTLEGAQLKMVSEATGGALSEKRSANGASSSVNSDMCTMVGPYAQLLHAEYLVERLAAMDVHAAINSVEVPDSQAFWVYLPPEMSEKEALRRLYEIQAKNIDSYIIPSGELANGISFGIYNDQSTAHARLEEIRMQGYQAKLRQIERKHSETWVTLPPGEAEKIDDAVWVDMLNQQTGLEKRQNLCLGVAPK
jgi:hypothetical protein